MHFPFYVVLDTDTLIDVYPVSLLRLLGLRMNGLPWFPVMSRSSLFKGNGNHQIKDLLWALCLCNIRLFRAELLGSCTFSVLRVIRVKVHEIYYSMVRISCSILSLLLRTAR